MQSFQFLYNRDNLIPVASKMKKGIIPGNKYAFFGNNQNNS